MAQTGYTPILLYSSSTVSQAPSAGNLTNSTLGSELAINITDGKLFYKDNANAVQVIAWKTTPTTAGGTGLTSYTAGDLLYYATGTTLSKLAIGSAYQALQVNAGGTAPSWQASATSTLTAQGDLLYASAANTLARLAKNTTATRYLSNTGSSNNPAWAQVDLSNGVTGTLPVGNGGTGLTTFTQYGVLYASTTGALATGSGFKFDGTNVMINSAPSRDNLNVKSKQLFYNTAGDGVTNTVIGQIRSQVRDYGTNIATASFASIQFATDPTTWYKGEIRFLTNGTDGTDGAGTVKMTINCNGAVGIGATPASIGGDLDVIGNQNGIGIGYDTSTYRRLVPQSTNVLSFASASNTATLSAAGAWTNASDARLKKNIETIKYGLETVMATQPRSYNRNDVDGDFIGFIAQELKALIPEVVFGSDDEQYTVDYGSLVAVAFKAIQELKTEIEILKGGK